MTRKILLSLMLSLCTTFSTCPSVAHACDPGWLPGDGIPGLQGSAEALITWDPDGAGPEATLLIAAGSDIVYADSEPASNIVAYDGDHWFSLGAGLSGGSVRALGIFNNELIAGGNFTLADGLPASRIARWDGTAWHSLGVGVDSDVNALAVYNSQLYAAGAFSTAGGSPASRIARWNGSTWSSLGTGISGTPYAMAVYNGFLYVGGSFTFAGGLVVSNLALWNGSTWSASGAPNGTVNTLTSITVGVFPNTNNILFLGGSFTAIGATSANHVASVSTASTGHYGSVGGGLTDPCRRIMARNTGGGNYEVIATTTPNPIAPQQVWRYNAGIWNVLGGSDHGSAQPLAYFNNRYVVGAYGDPATTPAVQSWDGTAWVPFGRGIGGTVKSLCALGADTIVGGDFEFISNVRVNHIARRDAVMGEWSALGVGVNNSVYAIVELPSGDLIVGGNFTVAGGVIANCIARWDGTNWSSLGSGVGGADPGGAELAVHALMVLPNGDVVAGGTFTTAGGANGNHVALWNGSSWSNFGTGFAEGTVHALAITDNGDILAAGRFDRPAISGTNTLIARWNGSGWSSLLQVANDDEDIAYAVVSLPDDNILLGGTFYIGATPLNSIKQYNGSNWINWGGNGTVIALKLLSNGDVILAGSFTNTVDGPANRIARWDGSNWFPLETGLTGVGSLAAYALAELPNGELAVGGDFLLAGDGLSANFARRTCGLPCVTDSDCKSDAVGANVDNACNCASCTDGSCVYTCSKFGNTSCDGGQLVNLDDVLCALAGFAGFSNCPSGDIAPCSGNGVINLDDILSVLNAFAGGNPCACDASETAPTCGSVSP